jgi:hypothetical protein
MRALATAAGLATLLTGCMASPEAEDLVFLEDEREEMIEIRAIPFVEPSQRVVPPAEPESEPEPATQTEPGSRRTSSRPRFVAAAPGPDACWGVEAVGFPAISEDGTTVVVPRDTHLQMSPVPGTMDLEWHDLASGAVGLQPIVIHEEFDETDDSSCNHVSRGIRRRARAANEALADVRWRVMEELPVALLEPSIADEPRAEYLAKVAPAERVVQLVTRHGEAVLRIPGVAVLERHSLLGGGEPFAVYGDRTTGTVVLVTIRCAGDSCTCDPSFTAQVLHWSDETFAAIEARPCTPGDEDATQAEDAQDSWTSCEPIEHEHDATPWAFG